MSSFVAHLWHAYYSNHTKIFQMLACCICLTKKKKDNKSWKQANTSRGKANIPATSGGNHSHENNDEWTDHRNAHWHNIGPWVLEQCNDAVMIWQTELFVEITKKCNVPCFLSCCIWVMWQMCEVHPPHVSVYHALLFFVKYQIYYIQQRKNLPWPPLFPCMLLWWESTKINATTTVMATDSDGHCTNYFFCNCPSVLPDRPV